MILTDYIIKHNKTHLIFDFDATLILLHADWTKLLPAMRDDIMQLDEELWRKHEHSHHVSGLKYELIDKHGDKGLDIIFRHQTAFELQYKDKYTKNEGLLAEIAEFRDTYRMFVWTSNTRDLAQYVLEQMGMNDWFEKVISRNDVRMSKPSPEGFELIRDPDVSLERYVLIGDSSKDEGAAKGAGIDFYKHDFFELGR